MYEPADEPDELFDTLEEALIRVRTARAVLQGAKGDPDKGEDVLRALRAIGECLPPASSSATTTDGSPSVATRRTSSSPSVARGTQEVHR